MSRDEATGKICPQCKQFKPLHDFFKSKSSRLGITCWCRDCGSSKSKEYRKANPGRHKEYIKKWTKNNREKIGDDRRKRRKNNLLKAREQERLKAIAFKAKKPHYHRDYRLRRIYGISIENYNSLLASQNGRCAICGTTDPGSRFKNMLVDHCHSTGVIRGLLCNSCNLLVGYARDNSKILLAVIEYLKS